MVTVTVITVISSRKCCHSHCFGISVTFRAGILSAVTFSTVTVTVVIVSAVTSSTVTVISSNQCCGNDYCNISVTLRAEGVSAVTVTVLTGSAVTVTCFNRQCRNSYLF